MCKKENSFAQWFINEFGLEKFNTVINHEKNIKSINNRGTTTKRKGLVKQVCNSLNSHYNSKY